MIDFGKHFMGDTFVVGYTAKGEVTLEKASVTLEGPEGSLISKSGKCAVEANRVTLRITSQLAPVKGEYLVFFSNAFSDGSERSLPAKFTLIERGWGEETQDVLVKQQPSSQNLPPEPREETQPSEGGKQPQKRDEEDSFLEDVTEVDGQTIIEIDDGMDAYDWLLTAEYLLGGAKEESSSLEEKGVAITPEVNTSTYGDGATDSLPEERKRRIEKATSEDKAREVGDRLGIDWKEVDLDQFRRGLKVELEHTSDPETRVVKPQDLASVGKIAWAHLKEKKDYYSRLKKIEVKKQDRGMSVKAIIRNEEGRILLIRDASSSYWDLPGGHVANSETVEEALRREVKEETGLELTEANEKETRLLTLGDEERPVAFYDCKAKGEIKLSSEHTTFKWVHPRAFKSYNLGAFKNILCGKPDRVFQKQEMEQK